MEGTKINVNALAQRTEDAYSFSNYGAQSWRQCIRILAKRGLGEREIEAILRSKWMRWAADGSNKPYGHVTSADLARFMDDPRNRITDAEIAKLTRETFEEGR